MKKSFFFLFLSLSLIGISCRTETGYPKEAIVKEVETEVASSYDSIGVKNRFDNGLLQVKNYLASHKNQFATDLAILVDMRLPSNYFRLFVTDLKKQTIVSRGLVAHGAGSEIDGTDSLQFSNVPNSYMTSLGMYKIGGAYQGSFGRSFKLHGLEKTNDKALARSVVLHRYQCVPDEEQAYPICTSLGCIMLSENYFETLATYIDARSKPILLLVYY